MLPIRDQCACLEHRVKHLVPKVPFATGWLATGTNSPHARSAHIARTPPVMLPVTLAPSQVVLNQTQNTKSIIQNLQIPQIIRRIKHKYGIDRYTIYRSHKSFTRSIQSIRSLFQKSFKKRRKNSPSPSPPASCSPLSQHHPCRRRRHLVLRGVHRHVLHTWNQKHKPRPPRFISKNAPNCKQTRTSSS